MSMATQQARGQLQRRRLRIGLVARVVGILVMVLALAGAIPALWQFALLRPLVVALYGQSLGLAWGLFACAAGFVLLTLSGLLAAIEQ